MTPRQSADARLILMVTVGDAIKKAAITQRTAAMAIGVTPQYLSDMLSGRRFFTPSALDALYKTTGATANIRDWRIMAVRARGWDL